MAFKRHELHLLWHRSGDIENIAVQAREDPSVALSIAGSEGTSDAKTAAICSQDVGVRRVFAHRACCVRRALAHSLAAARADSLSGPRIIIGTQNIIALLLHWHLDR